MPGHGEQATYKVSLLPMKHRQLHGNAGERPDPCRIAVYNGLGIEFGAVRVRRSEHYNNVFLSIFIENILNALLTILVKGSRGPVKNHRNTGS